MKLCIAGSRKLSITPDQMSHFMFYADINPNEITEIVSGEANGIDACGEWWAKANKKSIKGFKADWGTYKKAAGPIRNKEMAEYCDCALIFWDGQSKGTLNMIQTLDRLHKPYYTVIVTMAGWKNKKAELV